MASSIETLKDVAVQPTHDDIVRSNAEAMLAKDIPWDGYATGKVITTPELDLLKKYDKKKLDVKKELVLQTGETYPDLFLELLLKTNKEETFQYLLCLIDELITALPQVVKVFLKLSEKKPGFPFDPLRRLLARSTTDWFTNAKASTILSIFMSQATDATEQNVKYLCNWFRQQLRSSEERDVNIAVAALMKFLRNDDYRVHFAADEGLVLLAGVLKNKSKVYQLTYQTLHCVWLLSYNKTVAGQFGPSKLVNYVVSILRNNPREKLVRMCAGILANLRDTGNNNVDMIDAGILKPLESLGTKQWGDEDITTDFNNLKQALDKNIALLSSFDMYKTEVTSGSLEWSPVHTSEKFWKENVTRFEDDNFKILLTLKQFLSDTSNLVNTAIACFDLGEFARVHPRGRAILGQIGIKMELMALMEHKDTEVRKQALTAVQKMMVTNWQYLNLS